MKNQKVSIIVRTKNEERWIDKCLAAIAEQQHKNHEVIVVDNDSTDATVAKAKAFAVKLVNISQFRPGEALNIGIRASTGDVIVCLSAHCIPTGPDWLGNLITPLADANVAGVYGRQEPLPFSDPHDKRDLLTVFGLDRKEQQRDPFFHNANSAILRSTWEKFPFDEEVRTSKTACGARRSSTPVAPSCTNLRRAYFTGTVSTRVSMPSAPTAWCA